mmetsp:Transcript_732/g.769  ORF Transcript_732/g.769 Transcript_732/m.769 type:complete len:445 (-) Transcript_732:178-1512(-)
MEESKSIEETKVPQVVNKWQDEDDEEVQVDISKVARLRKLKRHQDEDKISGLEYQNRLREQFGKLHGHNKFVNWATKFGVEGDVDNEDGDDDGTQFQSRVGALKSTDLATLVSSGKETKLKQGTIEIENLKPANRTELSKSVISKVQFNPSGQILFTAGLDKALRLFQIDGDNNPKLNSVYFHDLPIGNASFTTDGSTIIASGRKKHYYTYDLGKNQIQKITHIFGSDERDLTNMLVSPDGNYLVFLCKNGYILFLCMKTRRLLFKLKMNGTCEAGCFSSDGSILFTAGSDGEIYQWNVSQRRCIDKFVDEGNINTNTLAISPNSTYLASGSPSGVVNVYNVNAANHCAVEPKPLKSLMNLTTSTDDLCFNNSSEILAICSKWKANAVRLAHIPSFTVFANWPHANQKMKFTHSLAFSPSDEYLATGNDEGRAFLYRLKHYSFA